MVLKATNTKIIIVRMSIYGEKKHKIDDDTN